MIMTSYLCKDFTMTSQMMHLKFTNKFYLNNGYTARKLQK